MTGLWSTKRSTGGPELAGICRLPTPDDDAPKASRPAPPVFRRFAILCELLPAARLSLADPKLFESFGAGFRCFHSFSCRQRPCPPSSQKGLPLDLCVYKYLGKLQPLCLMRNNPKSTIECTTQFASPRSNSSGDAKPCANSFRILRPRRSV
jgi:hypothetical protein